MLGNLQTHGLFYSPYNPIDHHHMSHLFLHGVHLSISTSHIISYKYPIFTNINLHTIII